MPAPTRIRKVLVIIHGKGAFGGHYGNIMQYALRSGLRVIVPDLPHYGMSGPGNLDKSPARTMQDMREVVHDLVVNQLGVKKAYLSGPFARRSARDGLCADLARGGAGPGARSAGRPRGISARGHDCARTRRHGCSIRPLRATSTSGSRPGIRPASSPRRWARSEQNVRDFFYFKKRDPVTGAVSAAKSGYFMNDSEYARFHTEQRVGMIKGNPKELEQWCQRVHLRHLHNGGAELQQDDPKNLYERLTQIKAPIFLAFGDKEPFIPGTAFNGLKDLGRDIITPFMTRMTHAGNRPILKIYPDTGHFIHTDNPVEYSADVVDFVTRDESTPVRRWGPTA